MKPLIFLSVIMMLISCTNNAHDEKQKQANSEEKITTDADELRREVRTRSAYAIIPDNTYVELNTGKRIKLIYDSSSGKIMEQGTFRQIDLFIDEATNDTVDFMGSIMNYKIKKKKDGTYVAEEDFASPK